MFSIPLRFQAVLLSLYGTLVYRDDLILALVLETKQSDVEGSDFRNIVLKMKSNYC